MLIIGGRVCCSGRVWGQGDRNNESTGVTRCSPDTLHDHSFRRSRLPVAFLQSSHQWLRDSNWEIGLIGGRFETNAHTTKNPSFSSNDLTHLQRNPGSYSRPAAFLLLGPRELQRKRIGLVLDTTDNAHFLPQNLQKPPQMTLKFYTKMERAHQINPRRHRVGPSKRQGFVKSTDADEEILRNYSEIWKVAGSGNTPELPRGGKDPTSDYGCFLRIKRTPNKKKLD